ncbi:MAG: hypothetical protein WA364_17785, partial [Candidatus Nitrosopolaris sp.]
EASEASESPTQPEPPTHHNNNKKTEKIGRPNESAAQYSSTRLDRIDNGNGKAASHPSHREPERTKDGKPGSEPGLGPELNPESKPEPEELSLKHSPHALVFTNDDFEEG